MASSRHPGGGVRDGKGAQEENLHRRMDAFRFLEQQVQDIPDLYPIPPESCLVSQQVTVFRGPESEGYPFLPSPFTISLISCAAVWQPTLSQYRNYRDRRQKEAMMKKAQVIVKAAVELDCDVLVLSAFGCGAFQNPPSRVAQFFKAALNEVSPECTLREVVFCISEDHNSYQWHNPEGNFSPFQEVFGQSVPERPMRDFPMPESPAHGPSGFPTAPEAEWPPGEDAWVGLEADPFAAENLMPAPREPSPAPRKHRGRKKPGTGNW
eukprot:15453857-Alexandrium_andersonii.AAC.1